MKVSAFLLRIEARARNARLLIEEIEGVLSGGGEDDELAKRATRAMNAMEEAIEEMHESYERWMSGQDD